MSQAPEPPDSGRAAELFRDLAQEVRRHLASLSAGGFAGWDVGEKTLNTLGTWGRPRPRAAAPPETLADIARELSARGGCAACPGSGNPVWGEGDPRARLMFVSDAPGQDEEGRPFSGAAGQLLADIIEKGMKIPRESVFVTHVVKCLSPDRRAPSAEEVRACLPWLWREIRAVGPEFLCALGATAAHAVLGMDDPLVRLRGKVHEKDGILVLCTHHPAAILQDVDKKLKPETWSDIQLLMARMNRAR